MTARVEEAIDDGAVTARLFARAGRLRALCLGTCWADTPLGPVAGWPISLRTIVSTLMAAGHPMLLWWGPERIQIFNDAFRPIFGDGDDYRRALGASAQECWTASWPNVHSDIERVLAGAGSISHVDALVPVIRDGARGDRWWNYSMGPAFDDESHIAGVLVVARETTQRVVGEREREKLERALRFEQSRLGALFQQSPSFLAVLRGPHHVFERVNDACQQIVGAERRLVGNPLFDALPELRGQGIEAYLAQVHVRQEPLVLRDLPLRLERTPGAALEERFVDVTFLPLIEADGRSDAIIAHGNDVSEQVRARRALEAAHQETLASEARLRAFADAIPTAAWTARADGYITWYNARWYEYTGTTPDEMEGWGWQSVHDPAVLPHVLERWHDCIESGDPFEMTFPLRGADGTFRSFLTRVVPLRDADGTLLSWFGINTDVETERRLREAAESASRAKGEFLAVMSHELRTPLNAIDGYATLLELGARGPVTDAQLHFLGRIRASGRHLLALINDVLDYAQMEAGATHYQLEDVPVCDALRAAEVLVAPQARARGLELILDSSSSHAVVRADPVKFGQVLVNLLSNAVKFTTARPTQSAAARVEASCAVECDSVAIHVRDDGIGISPDRLVSIFEPFVQVRTDATRSHEGVGLGLAISRDLARGMGGDLTVESQVGVGSVFTLRLPRARTD